MTTPKRPHITLHEVKSSQVKSVGFDHGTNTLAVQFARGTGAIYHYPNVTKDQYEAFINADSIGVHFGKHIKALPFTKYHVEKAPEHHPV
jgi:hypothetical protein